MAAKKTPAKAAEKKRSVRVSAAAAKNGLGLVFHALYVDERGKGTTGRGPTEEEALANLRLKLEMKEARALYPKTVEVGW